MLRQCPSSVLGLAALLGSVLALAACTSSDSGGSPGGGTAGNTGGASSGSDGGTASGSATGASGSSSSGTSGGCPPETKDASPPTVPICTGNAPSAPLIADFTAGGTAFGAFGMGPITGGTYIYPGCSDTIGDPVPAFPLTNDATAGNWHITGTVGD